MSKNAVFTGDLTALSHMIQIKPMSEKKAPGGYENVSFGTTMQIIAQNDKGDPYIAEFPVPASGNTIRSIVRNNISKDIIEKVYTGWDYLTLVTMFAGGTIKKETDKDKKTKTDKDKKDKKATVAEEDEKKELSKGDSIANRIALFNWQQRNLVISLLGTAAIKDMLPGKAIFTPLIPYTAETAGMIPGTNGLTLPSAASVLGTDYIYKIRKDDTNTVELLSVMNESEIAKKISYEKGDNINMLAGVSDYLLAGTRLYHTIEIINPTAEEIGAVYSALERFSEKPYLGAMSAVGWGKVEGTYTLKVDGEKIDTIRINDTMKEDKKAFECGDKGGYYKSYKTYLDNLTYDDIRFPTLKEGEKKTNKETKKKGDTSVEEVVA